MMEPLRSQFDSLWTADGLRGEVRRTAIAFPVLVLLAFGACMVFPALRDKLVSFVLTLMDSLDVTDQAGNLSAMALFSNNLQACAFVMVYGLLPFVYLPALSLGVNATLLGVLAAWYVSEGQSLAVYLASLLPHGIFEIPALLLSIAMGLYLCGQATRRCRKDESALPVWSSLTLASQLFLMVDLPLLAVAAVVEAYVTPLFASLFL